MPFSLPTSNNSHHIKHCRLLIFFFTHSSFLIFLLLSFQTTRKWSRCNTSYNLPFLCSKSKSSSPESQQSGSLSPLRPSLFPLSLHFPFFSVECRVTCVFRFYPLPPHFPPTCPTCQLSRAALKFPFQDYTLNYPQQIQNVPQSPRHDSQVNGNFIGDLHHQTIREKK